MMRAHRKITVWRTSDVLCQAVTYVGPSIKDRPKPRWISPSVVITIAASLYAIEESELLSRRRNPRFEQARALVVWCLRTVTAEPMSYPKIGRHMDGRDHSTAINLHVNAIALRLSNPFFDQCCTAMQRFFTFNQGGAHERA